MIEPSMGEERVNGYMDDNKKERLMISIITIACLGNIAETLVAGWETWMIPVMLIGAVVIWWLHIAQITDMHIRTSVCFVYASLLVFFHGVHEISFFDVSIVTLILMATFTLVDRKQLLSLILIEYAIIMVYQFILLYRHEGIDMDAVSLIRTMLHIGIVFAMYMFCRISVGNRLASNDRIEKWKEAVMENDHDMEDFLSNISHELRTPVNVISGMTTLLQKNNDSSELEAIRDAGIRLAHQIEDIQDYTEIKRGELHVEEENYMCISLVNDVISYYKSVDDNKGLELVVDLAPEMPTMMKGDIRKIHKLFRLLLDNSIKFTRHGGVYIRVFPVPHEYGINLTIEVTDTGIGMTRAQLSQLAKGMYQANKKRNRSTGGIGIGIPIVYGFVRKMGGFVNITSTKGAGTTVRITIPQQVVDNKPCLSIKNEVKHGIVFYTKPEKYRSAEIRDFYGNMALNLATGLKAKLYSSGQRRELERLVKELGITHIFTGMEEYAEDRDILDRLSSEGCKVVITADEGFKPTAGSGIMVIPKPLYAFPVVRILNGEEEDFANEDTGKLRFTGVSALIVDDEPMNLVVSSGLLREYKMFADTAGSGKEAIDKYASGEYDVIFMDHMMPEMDGVEAMKHIREVAEESGRRPIIIALTANALSGAREMFMREGFDGFIAKPIDISEFEHVMLRTLPDEMIRYEGRN